MKGISFPLKTCTNELNIHSSGNLSLNKISLNIFVKDFKHLSPPALNTSIETPEGPLAFLIFIWSIAHHNSSTSILLIALSTILASMLSRHLFSTSIKFYISYFQIFYTYFTAPISSLRQLIPTTTFFFPTLCLEILNNSRPSQHELIFSTVSNYLIHSHIYYSLSIFFWLAIFLPIFLILALFPNPK